MQRLWPSTQLPGRILLATALLSLACLGALPAWSEASPPSPVLPLIPLAHLEKTLHRVSAHISEFSPVAPPLDLPRCGNVRPPEALLTPDPPLHPADDQLSVRVSFIVGIDGHVHSAFVLDSGGPDEDQIVLRAVRFWRYRPALCNGVPTDAEALVRFSIR
jgi:TonB family protein